MSSRSLKCLVCEIFDISSWMTHRKSLYLHRVLRYVANHFKYLCKKMNFKIQRRCQNNVSNMPFYSRIVLKKRRISLGKMNQVAFLFSTRAQKQVNMPSANTTMRCWELSLSSTLEIQSKLRCNSLLQGLIERDTLFSLWISHSFSPSF